MTPGTDEVIVVPPGSGEVIGDAPDRRVEILSDADRAARHVVALRARARRRRPARPPPPHRPLLRPRRRADLRLGPEDERVAVPAGTLVRVPPIVVHGFRNASADTEVRYLNLHAPGVRVRGLPARDARRAQFTYDQEPPPADGGRAPSDAVDRRRPSSPSATAAQRAARRRRRDRASPRCCRAGVNRRRRTCIAGTSRRSTCSTGSSMLARRRRALRRRRRDMGAGAPGVAHAISAAGEARYLEVRAQGFSGGSLDRRPRSRAVSLVAARTTFDPEGRRA